MYVVFFILFLIGLYGFFLKSVHLLIILLSLEILRLVIFVSLFSILWGSSEEYIVVYYLTLCVCEGAFGLRVLVRLVRSVGRDYLQRLMFLKC